MRGKCYEIGRWFCGCWSEWKVQPFIKRQKNYFFVFCLFWQDAIYSGRVVLTQALCRGCGAANLELETNGRGHG